MNSEVCVCVCVCVCGMNVRIGQFNGGSTVLTHNNHLHQPSIIIIITNHHHHHHPLPSSPSITIHHHHHHQPSSSSPSIIIIITIHHHHQPSSPTIIISHQILFVDPEPVQWQLDDICDHLLKLKDSHFLVCVQKDGRPLPPDDKVQRLTEEEGQEKYYL